jgi:hypothetical protein
MQIAFDLNKATSQINDCPALAAIDFPLGKHVVTLEKITTIWHLTWNKGVPDYVFRVSIDGLPCFDFPGHRAFLAPLSATTRRICGNKVFFSKPEWLPREITKAKANAAFDAAMTTLLA